MLSALILAASLLTGQQFVERNGRTYERFYEATDARGQVWSDRDRDNLTRWVRERNAQIRAEDVRKVDPVDAATKALADEPATVVNFGVAMDKIPRVSRAWVGGNTPPSFGVARQSKSNRVHLTVIATTVQEAERTLKAWRADPEFASLETSMGDGLAVQAYGADNPLVSEVGLADGGKPDVIVQTADGKVLARWHNDPGSGVVTGEVRKRREGYDPSRDPAGGDPSELFAGLSIPMAVFIAACGFLLWKGPAPR